MAYEAVVARIHTRPHPNADRLLLGTCAGYQVVVGTNITDGQLGVMFVTDGQLSEEMCAANDLIEYKDPDTGERKGGYFSAKRRVRSQKLRGEKSDGFWCPLEHLAFTGYDISTLVEGQTFTELNGVPICNKYYTPATLKAMKEGRMGRANNLFAKHYETAQLKREYDNIPEDSIVWVTEKLHGTSGRLGHVLDTSNVKTPKWKHPFYKLFKLKNKTVTAYKYIMGTRNIILADHKAEGFYGNEEFRWNATQKLMNNLHKGEILYFEIVGFTTTGGAIMSVHSNDKLKEVKKAYGPSMTYAYGQAPATAGLYVYRITRVNEDGNAVELSWPQVKARCNQLGISHVPELGVNPIHIRDNGMTPKMLVNHAENLAEGPSTLDKSHIREGVCVRVDKPDGDTKTYKYKSFTFGVLEGFIKDSDDYVDAEEIS